MLVVQTQNFEAEWYGVGIGFNGGGLRIRGESPRYAVRWGDGAVEGFRTDRDGDGDDMFGEIFHSYASDGTYDVSVTRIESGEPPLRLKAYAYANATNDISIAGTSLNDLILGGSGNDFLRGGGGNDAITGGAGNDRISGGDGEDFLIGAAGDDVIKGDAGSDLITGQEGNDRLYGGDGRDSIFGEIGNDFLFGDGGDDYLDGGAGRDRLTGGAGSDVFNFAPLQASDGSTVFSDPDRDIIVDFAQGQDHIRLTDWGPLTFIGSDDFSGTAGELRFTDTGSFALVFGDVDGDRISDFSIRVEGVASFTSTDFFLQSAEFAA